MATKKAKVAAETEAVLRVYEAGYHIASSVKEDELESIVGGIRSIIEKAGGIFIAEGAPVLTKLAYTMYQSEKGKRIAHDRGYFGWIKFESPTTLAKDLSDALQKNKEIIRSMVFVTLREDTRAKFRVAPVREVKRGESKAVARSEEEAVPVSEEKLDKALETLTE